MLGQSISKYIVGFLFLAGCAAQTAQVQETAFQEGTYRVQKIELVEDNGQVQMLIHADPDLRYNVFKLTDPHRIMVDLIDARPSANLSTEIEGKGIIQRVQVQAIEDALSSLVRLEVRLAADANYLVGAEADGLAVRVFPIGGDWQLRAEEDSIDDFFEDDWGAFGDIDLPAFDDLEEIPTPSEMAQEAPVESPSFEDESFDFFAEEEAFDFPSFEMAEEPAVEAPKMAESVPAPELPKPAPVVQMPEQPQVAQTPAPAIDPMPLPSFEDLEPVSPPAKARVIVEPEEEEILPAPIQTQDISASVFTEGTSLLSGMGDRVYTGTRVSLEFQDAEIQDVIRLIAEVSKLNVIIGDNVTGRITLKLVDVPWDQALDIILTSRGLDKVQHGNILRVAPVEALKREREVALANDQAAKQLEPLRLKLFNVNYAQAGEMAGRIQNLLSERGKVDVDQRTNTLIVEDIGENLSRVENLIRVLDTQTPQVRIESRIVQASDTFGRSIGIQWGPTLRLDESNNNQTSWQFPRRIGVGAPIGDPAAGFRAPSPGDLGTFAVDALPGAEESGGALGFRLGSVSEVFNLDLQLRYAETEQIARVVSRPSITVLDNRTARIIQGSRIPFLSTGSEGSNVSFQDAGIEVSVTPQITNDGAIILQVSTRSNEPGGAGVGGNQIINIREAETQLLVKSGRTAVLGGVFKTTDNFGRGGVPGLMRLPILGWLFKGESKTVQREETLIFITPTILSDGREAVMGPAENSERSSN
ncbi:MAG: type IV pilus secretin PilQ [Bradymonadales bacterium]|nr:MAG: type IV pilus secretin PilQ [Bradymonadales bacterium]